MAYYLNIFYSLNYWLNRLSKTAATSLVLAVGTTVLVSVLTSAVAVVGVEETTPAAWAAATTSGSAKNLSSRK